MALDDGSIAGTGFDDVGVNRPLRQEVDGSDFTAFVFKDADKFFTDDFPLPFGITDASSLERKRSDASTRMKFMPLSLNAFSTSSPSFLRRRP